MDAGDELILDQLATVLREHIDVVLEVRGYTDNVGDLAKNLDLAGTRALAVYEYLVNQGVDARRLSARAIGEDHPIAPNDTREGRRLNRRVEFSQRR